MTLLQRLLGFLDASRLGTSHLSNAELRQVEEVLTRLVLERPQAVRAALVGVDGLLLGCFPRQSPVDKDRVSAMTAAMWSLGERICGELGSGDLRHVVIGGAKTWQLMVVLSQDYALELELRLSAPVDSVLDAVKESVAPLLPMLGIESWTALNL